MAEYFYINNYTKRGKLAISCEAFNDLVTGIIHQIGGISLSEKKKGALLSHKPVHTEIKNGQITSTIEIKVSPNLNQDEVNDLVNKIKNEVKTQVEIMSEVDTFNVQVKVLGVDKNLK